jgi:hypothetical protein
VRFTFSPTAKGSLVFRRGGSTEVDINDVSFALQKVIVQRRAEDTWQVDTFGGVSATPTRPPDEVRVLSARLPISLTWNFQTRLLSCALISASL